IILFSLTSCFRYTPLLHSLFTISISGPSIPILFPLHDALPISRAELFPLLPSALGSVGRRKNASHLRQQGGYGLGSTRQSYLRRSEEHTSELQSRFDLVCRLLLEKKHVEVFNFHR